jgi:putative Holliday junction resolvase
MQVLALDIGEKRTGIAASDASGKIAMPISVMPTADILANSKTFIQVLNEYQPELLLCGLPISLDGQEHAQATKIRQLATTIAGNAQLPLEFADERHSSTEAKQILRQSGHTERTMRGKTDKIAASLFLQTWLDAKNLIQD